MKKYSVEWKMAQGAWIQDHHNDKWGRYWKLHYIQNGTEYSKGEYITKEEANQELAAFKAASDNGAKGGRPRKCHAHECWCGNKAIKVSEIIKDEEGFKLYERLSDGSAYIATEGYTEHWASESDMLEQYPELRQE